MSESASSPRRLAARELEIEVLSRRRRGMSFRRVAAELGCSPTGAYRAAARALERVRAIGQRFAEDTVQLELLRLDDLLSGVWPAATGGDPKAVRAVLAVMERRAKLLGLDAAEKIDVNGAVRIDAVQAALDRLDAAGLSDQIDSREAAA